MQTHISHCYCWQYSLHVSRQPPWLVMAHHKNHPQPISHRSVYYRAVFTNSTMPHVVEAHAGALQHTPTAVCCCTDWLRTMVHIQLRPSVTVLLETRQKKLLCLCNLTNDTLNPSMPNTLHTPLLLQNCQHHATIPGHTVQRKCLQTRTSHTPMVPLQRDNEQQLKLQTQPCAKHCQTLYSPTGNHVSTLAAM